MRRCFWYITLGWLILILLLLMTDSLMIKSVTAAVVGDKIEIMGKTLELKHVDDTTVDAAQHVNKYGEKLFYGHNLPNVFGDLDVMTVGGKITVTENDAKTEYIVTEIMVFDKISGEILAAEGQKYAMSAIAEYAKGYDAALMTCTGETYKNGDASQRLVVFANKI